MLGLYRTAGLKLEQLKTDYPTSKYLHAGAEPALKALPEEKRPDSSAVATNRAGKAGDAQQQFTLQVGAYTTQVNAEKQKLFLTA